MWGFGLRFAASPWAPDAAHLYSSQYNKCTNGYGNITTAALHLTPAKWIMWLTALFIKGEMNNHHILIYNHDPYHEILMSALIDITNTRWYIWTHLRTSTHLYFSVNSLLLAHLSTMIIPKSTDKQIHVLKSKQNDWNELWVISP